MVCLASGRRLGQPERLSISFHARRADKGRPEAALLSCRRRMEAVNGSAYKFGHTTSVHQCFWIRVRYIKVFALEPCAAFRHIFPSLQARHLTAADRGP